MAWPGGMRRKRTGARGCSCGCLLLGCGFCQRAGLRLRPRQPELQPWLQLPWLQPWPQWPLWDHGIAVLDLLDARWPDC